jgi:hypothetical protein
MLKIMLTGDRMASGVKSGFMVSAILTS